MLRFELTEQSQLLQSAYLTRYPVTVPPYSLFESQNDFQITSAHPLLRSPRYNSGCLLVPHFTILSGNQSTKLASGGWKSGGHKSGYLPTTIRVRMKSAKLQVYFKQHDSIMHLLDDSLAYLFWSCVVVVQSYRIPVRSALAASDRDSRNNAGIGGQIPFPSPPIYPRHG